ncbi:MAG: hypothetical protein FVQ82_17380 [Planctomycetes bacterium]|nr:hypothetical protein [Planctomycetota bacterium]
MNIEKLKLDKKYKDIFSVTRKEQQAIEMLALQDGEIYQPLFVWKDQGILIYGYQYLKVIKAHPEIKHTIREIEFEGWEEAQVWAIEHYIAQPEILLWQKLEASVGCGAYWLLKEDAKKAQGVRADLSTVTVDKSDDSKEVNAIIGRKVGCSTGYVYNFKKILSSGKTDIIKLCRKGELSISAAYSRLFTPKPPRKRKTTPVPSAPIELEIDGSDIFDECEDNIDVGKKNTNCHNGIPVDPNQIINEITATNVPDGSIWITLHKNDHQIQVVKRTYDEAKGSFQAKVNAYNYKVITSNDELIILQADHINGSTTEASRKDDREFGKSSQMAS